jgi:hypothetical protein
VPTFHTVARATTKMPQFNLPPIDPIPSFQRKEAGP